MLSAFLDCYTLQQSLEKGQLQYVLSVFLDSYTCYSSKLEGVSAVQPFFSAEALETHGVTSLGGVPLGEPRGVSLFHTGCALRCKLLTNKSSDARSHPPSPLLSDFCMLEASNYVQGKDSVLLSSTAVRKVTNIAAADSAWCAAV